MFILLVHTRALCVGLWAELNLIIRQPRQCRRCSDRLWAGLYSDCVSIPSKEEFRFFRQGIPVVFK